jgi:circadian clock protein KaiB
VSNTRARGQTHARANELRLRLYVAGNAPNSLLARQNLKSLLAALDGKDAKLSIIDVFEHPDLVREDQVYVTPMLIRLLPLPECRIIGNLANHEAVLQLLGTGGDGAES